MITQAEANELRGFAIHPTADQACSASGCALLGQFIRLAKGRVCHDHAAGAELSGHCARCGVIGRDRFSDFDAVDEIPLIPWQVAVGPSTTAENLSVAICAGCFDLVTNSVEVDE
jgi:hypothetical protein